MRFVVATWNINSVRLRLPLIKRFLKRHAPDVLCLQETKCPDDKFPRRPFAEIGHPHVEIYKQMWNAVSNTPVEVEKFRVFQHAGGWIDVMRDFVPVSEKLYTWWSYRAADWELSDRGRRLDHIWASPALAGAAREMTVVRAAR